MPRTLVAFMLLTAGIAAPAVAAPRGNPTCLGQPATLVVEPGFALAGTPGPDVIVGTVGDDVINGAGGDDRICALGGSDIVSGGNGVDRISGGGGDDVLKGGKGQDALAGGRGRDTCRLGPGDGSYLSCERPARIVTITIEDFSFGEPASQPTGTAVLVTNADASTHTWTSTTDDFDSGGLSGATIFSHRFTEPGTYGFSCTIHPSMQGSITIEPPRS